MPPTRLLGPALPDPVRRAVDAFGGLPGLAFVGVAVALFLRLPLATGDTDLFYHLAHGRWIVEHGALPTTAYFSFVAPELEWLDYSWLFQVVVFAVERMAGETGLVVFRALLFAAMAAAVGGLAFGGGRRRGPLPWAIWVTVLLVLIPRSSLLRPHVVSELCLALLLLVRVRTGRWPLWTPLLALVWMNAHGVTYPILLFVLGADGLERVAALWAHRSDVSGAGDREIGPGDGDGDGRAASGDRDGREDLRSLAVGAVTALTVLATPLGVDLLPIAFLPLDDVSGWIVELAPFDPDRLVSFVVEAGVVSPGGLFAILALATVVAVLRGVRRRRLGIFDVALLALVAILLPRGFRFESEAALLALPVLAQLPAGRWPRGEHLPWVLVLVALPFVTLVDRLSLDSRLGADGALSLPLGTTGLLEDVDGGRVAHAPTPGGYLLWRLHPRHLLTGNMQIPHLFASREMFVFGRMFSDPPVFERFRDRYRPDFWLVPATDTPFERLAAQRPSLVPIHFDDTAILYVEADRRPELAQSRALRAVDPWRIFDGGFRPSPGPETLAARSELQRVLAVDDRNVVALQALAIVENGSGRPAEALAAADRALALVPGLPQALALSGEALLGLDRPGDAIRRLRRAVERADKDTERRIYLRVLAAAQQRAGNLQGAAKSWAGAAPTFEPGTSPAELLHRAKLAEAIGEVDEAFGLIYLALLATDPAETERVESLRRELERLSAAPGP